MYTYTKVEQRKKHGSLCQQVHSITVDAALQLVYWLQLSINCTNAFLCKLKFTQKRGQNSYNETEISKKYPDTTEGTTRFINTDCSPHTYIHTSTHLKAKED